ncbi:MAG: galactokinase [Verrucomicrobiota bacterium]
MTSPHPIEIFAPGRAELLGNHTDYNEGLVMAIAVDRGITMRGRKSKDGQIRLRSESMDDEVVLKLDQLAPQAGPEEWANYLLGVVELFQERGEWIDGFEAEVASDLPMGAGLSSSAALEVATGLFLQTAFKTHLEPLELARIAQKAEHTYTGVQCGLLDQISSLMSQAGHVTFIDCRTYEVQHVPLPEGVGFVIANSGVKHALTGGEYNERRASCEAAAQAFGVEALRDVSPTMLIDRTRIILQALDNGGSAIGKNADGEDVEVEIDLELEPGQDPVEAHQIAAEAMRIHFRRAAHVVGEIARVEQGANFLRAGDAREFGRLMYASHESSIINFENSCPELDALVEATRGMDYCYGARLSGGGFGGATINLVEAGREDDFVTAINQAFPGTECLVTSAAAGAGMK